MLTNAAIVLILVVAAYALVRGLDVRLVLFAAALVLASLAKKPWIVLDAFRTTMANVEIVGPICSAMGYAYVLKLIGADRELVRLLIAPVRRVPWLLIPGGCAAAFITNMAVVSQTAVAAAVGIVLIPLMRAAGYHPLIAAATLVLGCSGGGNLLNPGDADLVAILTTTAQNGGQMDAVWNAMVVPHMLGFVVATVAFWILSRWPPRIDSCLPGNAAETNTTTEPIDCASADEGPIDFSKALLPPLPIVMLFATWPRVRLFPWLLELYPDGLPVTHAVVIATIIAMLVSRSSPSSETKAFFEGMGYGYVHVISLIIVATSFIDAMKAIGLLGDLVTLIGSSGPLGKLAAGFFPWLLAVICGSGTAPSVAFSKAVLPELSAVDLAGAIDLGVMGSIAATYGRTMSPVSAIVIFTSAMTNVPPLQIVKRTAPALAAGALVVLAIMLAR
jgi:DcuC family C4-dicarboxylate transporter